MGRSSDWCKQCSVGNNLKPQTHVIKVQFCFFFFSSLLDTKQGATFAACVADSASSKRNSLARLRVVAVSESIPSNRRKTFLKDGIKAPRMEALTRQRKVRMERVATLHLPSFTWVVSSDTVSSFCCVYFKKVLPWYARGSLCLLLIIILSSGRTQTHTHVTVQLICLTVQAILAWMRHLSTLAVFFYVLWKRPNPSAGKNSHESHHCTGQTDGPAQRFPFPFAFVTCFSCWVVGKVSMGTRGRLDFHLQGRIASADARA